MRVLEWLMAGDPVIQRLTTKFLLDGELPYTEEGYIKRYLELFDESKGLWGGGRYGPKWISTHYTLMELKYMGIDPTHKFYHVGLSNVIDSEWRPLNGVQKISEGRLDVCIIAMLVSLSAYGHSKDPRLYEMIDFLILRQMGDGGWNCSWTRNKGSSKKSSLHTTLSVLEAFKDLEQNGYAYRAPELKKMTGEGETFILKKRLFRSESTGEVINEHFLTFHYPARWKYEVIRALEYFADVQKAFDPRMQEGLDQISSAIQRGYLLRGAQYSGKVHYKLETTRGGRFNTLRALKILKFYNPSLYETTILRDDIVF
jgi:hypothetical protein